MFPARFFISLALCFPAFAWADTQCGGAQLRKEQIAMVKERRAATIKHCLSCTDNRCFMDAANLPKELQTMCRVLFCTPRKNPKLSVVPTASHNGNFHYKYAIGTNGRVKDIQMLSATGKTDDKRALELVENLLERRKYIPIKVDGEAYELHGLEGQLNFTWRGSRAR